jgi:hypothetical protein
MSVPKILLSILRQTDFHLRACMLAIRRKNSLGLVVGLLIFPLERTGRWLVSHNA